MLLKVQQSPKTLVHKQVDSGVFVATTQLQMSHNFHTNVVSRCVKGRMGNSTSTCSVLWMWASSLGEPSLTWRAQRRRWGYWRVESTMTILSSWLWVFISRIYLLGFHRFVTYYPFLLFLWTAWTLLCWLATAVQLQSIDMTSRWLSSSVQSLNICRFHITQFLTWTKTL